MRLMLRGFSAMAQLVPTASAHPYSSDEDDPDLVLAHVKLENFELQGKLKMAEQTATELRKSLQAATEQRYNPSLREANAMIDSKAS